MNDELERLLMFVKHLAIMKIKLDSHHNILTAPDEIVPPNHKQYIINIIDGFNRLIFSDQAFIQSVNVCSEHFVIEESEILIENFMEAFSHYPLYLTNELYNHIHDALLLIDDNLMARINRSYQSLVMLIGKLALIMDELDDIMERHYLNYENDDGNNNSYASSVDAGASTYAGSTTTEFCEELVGTGAFFGTDYFNSFSGG